jgi:hypothetical protein
LAGALLAAGLFSAAPERALARGDGDGFPLACVDFGGRWKSDSGTSFRVLQLGCEWLQFKVQLMGGSDEITTTIVPDNQARSIPGSPVCGVVRYRWNSLDSGTAIETHRKKYLFDRVVTELVTLEHVNDGLVLESTYRTIEFKSGEHGPPQHEYKQEVFRRVQESGLNPPSQGFQGRAGEK